ncbi:hypothetical protein [Pleurocapsa sp. PCC 7319]|uniref:hypothetical protein n=1 Tax=Pleurocapsa sp. PCC 7319 TaxID=118161 RepID=UPI0003462A97|nr:hypothetical protein [Pleurocapsa sp. PCC 7319]
MTTPTVKTGASHFISTCSVSEGYAIALFLVLSLKRSRSVGEAQSSIFLFKILVVR